MNHTIDNAKFCAKLRGFRWELNSIIGQWIPPWHTGLTQAGAFAHIKEATLYAITCEATIPFSAQAVRDGYWEYFHDDDCGETLDNGLCRKCGFVVDLQ